MGTEREHESVHNGIEYIAHQTRLLGAEAATVALEQQRKTMKKKNSKQQWQLK